MEEQRQFICITCPVGCTIDAFVQGNALRGIQGQACQRGIAFVEEELTAPKRVLTTTVRVQGGQLPLVPVRSARPLPKGLLRETVAYLRQTVLTAPVEEQQIVAKDVLGTGVDIVATRAIPAQGPN